MLTHLRTGADIVRDGAIPRHDPYSWTAHGHEWVVQSWLAEWTYGLLDKWGGLRLVLLQQVALGAVLAWLTARLARSGHALRTAVAAGVAVGVGAAYWSQRPLLFGLICFALLVTLVERDHNPWLVVPVFWVWVNTHGSFPLGLAWLGARGLGEALELRTWTPPVRSFAVPAVSGLALAAVNPLGPRLLAFPLTVGDKRDVFRSIVEWQSPDFQSSGGLVALALLGVALALLMARRAPWRDALPVVVFLAAGLYAVRNLALLGVVIAPALGRALRPPAIVPPDERRPPLNTVFLALIGMAAVLFTGNAVAGRALRLDAYPVKAVDALERGGYLERGRRVAHQDFVGNYLEFRFGRNVRVFIDDRYDMYPADVAADYRALLHPDTRTFDVLAERRVDLVLWERDGALVQLLDAARWRRVYRDSDWVVLERPPRSREDR